MRPPLHVEARLEKRLLALHAAMGTDALIRAVFRLIAAGVRSDFVSVCLRCSGPGETRLMLDSLGRRFDAQYLQRFFECHPGIPQLAANPGMKISSVSEVRAVTPKTAWTKFEGEFMRDLGFEYAVALFFYEPPPGHAIDTVFSVQRDFGDVDFSPAEVETLRRLHPHIETALRRVQKQLVSTVAFEGAKGLIRQGARAVVVLDWDLNVSTASGTARDACMLWRHGPAGRSLKKDSAASMMPADLLAVCKEMKREWLRSLDADPVSGGLQKRELVSPQCAELSATVSHSLPRATPMSRPGFVVEFRSPADFPGKVRTSQGPAAPWENLTSHQRHLAGLVCEGLTNREIAEREHKALGSIKNELYELFKQLGITSRAKLIASMRA